MFGRKKVFSRFLNVLTVGLSADLTSDGKLFTKLTNAPLVILLVFTRLNHVQLRTATVYKPTAFV